MWNIFKFFFVWFWLGFGAWFLSVVIAPPTVWEKVLANGRHVVKPGDPGGTVVGLVLGFVMCIPAYFIARPKRAVS
jgi:hypothetical protein